jgi:CRISPR system Cascade subunit CasA
MTMNLTLDPWIPAVRADGTRDLFSLHALFAEAHTLRDLAVRPHERIALMRLLLCITQAALDGPADEDAWRECRDNIQPRVRAYLDQWRAAFELFGDGPRFLQCRAGVLGPKSPVMENEGITRLDLSLASGDSTPSLFDTDAGSNRLLSDASIALSLLTYQCYSPLLGRGYLGRAPCADASALHTILVGGCILDTLHANILTIDSINHCYGSGKRGRPIWEVWKNVTSVETQTMLVGSYIGRLVPISRSIWIESEHEISLANGLVYEGFDKVGYREATVTLITKYSGEIGVLRCNAEKATWRELPAILTKIRSDTDDGRLGGPIALENNNPSAIALWCGGMIFPKDQAKIKDSIEAKYAPELFRSFNRAAYETGVKHAEAADSALWKSVEAYSTYLKIDSPAYDLARQHFWTRVEQALGDLFTVARELTPLDQLAASPWGRAIRAAALDAYERTCPHRTPRQIQAFALGRRHLFISTFAPNAKKSKAKTKSS